MLAGQKPGETTLTNETGLRHTLSAKEERMTNPVAIMLTEEQLSRLEIIAEAREETVASTVQEAVTAFLHKDAEYRAYIQDGLDDIAAGRVHDWEDVKAEMRAKYGVPTS